MSRKAYGYIALVGAFILLPFLMYQIKDTYFQNPFDKNLHFVNPSFITADTSHNMYIIDQSMKRIVKTTANGDVVFSIEGGNRETGSFFYASELAVDPAGYFYVLNRVLDSDGAFVEKEEIIRFNSKGKYAGTIYSREYPEGGRPLREGWISSLECRDGSIYCCFKGQGDVEMYTIPLDGSGNAKAKRIFSLENARVMLVDVKCSGQEGKCAYTTKKGEIYTVDGSGNSTLLYSVSGSGEAGGASIPWKLNMDGGENLCFADLGVRKIRSIDVSSGEIRDLLSPDILKKQGFEEECQAFYQFYHGADGSLFTINNGRIIYQGENGAIVFYGDSAGYPGTVVAGRILAWLLPLAWLSVVVLMLRRLYIDVLKRNFPRTAVQIAFIFITVTLSAGIVSDMLFKSFFTRYENKVLDNLAQTVQLAPSVIDGDAIQRIDNLEQFMGWDYNSVRRQLFKIFNDNQDPWNAGQYGALYKVADNKVYALMFYDDSIGTYYPIDFDYKNSKYMPVYDRGKIITIKESDADGDWIYALGPIYNSRGEIVAMVEVGTDLFGFVEENKTLVKNIVIDMATILVVLIFVLTELSILGGILSGRRAGPGKDTGPGAPGLPDGGVDIVRPLGFIMFTGTFMSVSFIPVLMKDLYQPVLGLPESVVLGLPISAEMLFVALFSVLAGYMIDARGWKPAFLTGMVVLAAGTLLSGLTHNQFVFIFSRAVVGSGFGLAIIALQTFAMSGSTEEEKNKGIAFLTSGVFSGMNVGVVVGAMLAERMGFSNVFFAAFGIIALAGIFAYKMIPNLIVSSREAVVEKVSLAKVGHFFSNLNVLAFFLLIFIPVSICGMFLMYFFPLFAEESGISSSNIGRAFMLNGLCIIYLGPFLTKYIAKYLGAMKSVVVYTLLVAGAMLLFANQGTVTAAFVAIIILGIADSFGIALLINYFAGLRAASELGQGKAMGYYSLVEYVGQMLGPIALGWMMIMGAEKGVGIVGIALCAALLLFVLLSGKERAVRSGDKDGMAA
ncbi:inner membrane transport protein [Desulfocucumis palustris]|uniref:Inner membrane transport protein n=1 Tax=Desulfocucumis palustris TaxID=1898651 RepID=A0A2L2XLI0_9FIRM|nr:MFS transporter [Desulfocucumis palustris]GBF34811.1 inner membrane transport protein [Desulfocucumis palustris]